MGLFTENIVVSDRFNDDANAIFLHGNCLDTLDSLPENSVKLIVTSPPYNLDKEYETKAALDDYLAALEPIIDKLCAVLAENGSICWQVGNFVEDGEVFPLDMYFYGIFKKKGMRLRNRIIWYFDHGLHAKKRFSGRYETLLWFTKSSSYTFNLDPVRVPAKYPGKRNYKPGPNYGKPSGNPLGKNPSDIWKIMIEEWEEGLWNIPNVKANHPEKTLHPCQFPIELVERCVLAFTDENDIVLDPFSGVGSAMLAALKQNRRAVGCEMHADYIIAAKERVKLFCEGNLPYRPLGKPVHSPSGKEKVSQRPIEWSGTDKLI